MFNGWGSWRILKCQNMNERQGRRQSTHVQLEDGVAPALCRFDFTFPAAPSQIRKLLERLGLETVRIDHAEHLLNAGLKFFDLICVALQRSKHSKLTTGRIKNAAGNMQNHGLQSGMSLANWRCVTFA